MDPIVTGALISGGAGILGNLISGVSGNSTTDRQIASNEKMNAENIAYQRELNNLIMQREDNAHVREAQDLTNAGLSRFATMNGAGAGGTMSAPSNDIGSMQNAYANQLSNIQSTAQGITNSISNTYNETMNHLLADSQLKETMRHNKESEADVSRKTALAENEFAWQKTVDLFKQDIEDRKLELANKQYKTDKEKADAEIKLKMAQTLESEARKLQTEEATRYATETHDVNVKKNTQMYTDMLLKHRRDINDYEHEKVVQLWEEEVKECEAEIKRIESIHAATKAEQEEKRRDLENHQRNLDFVKSLLKAIPGLGLTIK